MGNLIAHHIARSAKRHDQLTQAGTISQAPAIRYFSETCEGLAEDIEQAIGRESVPVE